MLPILILTGCKPPPDAPTELNELAGFLFEHFDDEDPEGLEVGVANLIAWYGEPLPEEEGGKEGDINLDATADGYSVDDLAVSVLDSVNPDREHDLENFGGASVAYESSNKVPPIARVLLLEEQEELFPSNYDAHDREYLTDQTCFMSHECDFVDTDNVVAASYPLGIKLDTHSRAQYRWVEFDKDQYAFLHRTWLVDEVTANVDWVDIKEQLYVGVTVPWKGNAVRLGTTWISADILDGVVSEGTALQIMIDSMKGEGKDLDRFLDGDEDEEPAEEEEE